VADLMRHTQQIELVFGQPRQHRRTVTQAHDLSGPR
jgi:hypothetical protein